MVAPLRAGRLRHVVVIQQKTETQSDTGAVEVTWIDFATVFAEIVSLSGREYLTAQQEQAYVIARATVRLREDIEPLMRLLFKGQVYNIAAVLPDPDWKEFMTLMLETGRNDG